MHDVWREMADRLALRYGTVPRDLWRLLAAPAALEMMHELGGAGQREQEIMQAAIAILEGDDDAIVDDMHIKTISVAMTAVGAMRDAARWVTDKHYTAIDVSLDIAYRYARKCLNGEG